MILSNKFRETLYSLNFFDSNKNFTRAMYLMVLKVLFK
ncbi:hypothetical protein EU98_1829 [Prochlorococcus marinus str. MIT 9314]|uniref:Uncharacterized protein n=1 Tax=Prochlorococcus marinus str. MIT 9314 TaxID=167548 RepID=A0A0A2AHK8_PROMR|nr:hypothetical protein EU98_1829 [Prochlorococcus marinus str. MIT 9314]